MQHFRQLLSRNREREEVALTACSLHCGDSVRSEVFAPWRGQRAHAATFEDMQVAATLRRRTFGTPFCYFVSSTLSRKLRTSAISRSWARGLIFMYSTQAVCCASRIQAV